MSTFGVNLPVVSARLILRMAVRKRINQCTLLSFLEEERTARFAEGEDRAQQSLLPARLEDYVATANPVRLVDDFVDTLLKVQPFNDLR